MIHFILIRHGETDWTKERRYQGSSNVRLNTQGRRQVRRFVREVTSYRPEIIFSSELGRCRESAEILCRPMGMNPMVDPRLNELSFGDWEGKTADELVEEGNPQYARWITGKAVTPKGGESVMSLRKRVRVFIEDCVREHDNKRIVIVTHGGPIRMFLLEILKLSQKDLFQFRIDPGTMTVLGYYRYIRQLVYSNSTSPMKGLVPEGCV